MCVQVDAAAWREFQKLKEQLEQEKRDMTALTAAFIDHRAQAAADSLVRPACSHTSRQCTAAWPEPLWSMSTISAGVACAVRPEHHM